MRNIFRIGIALVVFFGLIEARVSGDDNILFIQAVHTGLFSEPKMGGTPVEELKRGDRVQILEKKEIWYHVRHLGGHGEKSGWVSRLFLSDHQPIGNAELSKEVDVSLEKASRRRSSSYAVSASTRGLSADERVRGGRALYHSDFDALSEMETFSVTDGELQAFKRNAHLPQ